MLQREPIVRAAAIVALFWFGVLSLAALHQLRLDLLAWKAYMVAVAGLGGALLTAWLVGYLRSRAAEHVTPGHSNGVSSTIGVVPLHRFEPPLADTLPTPADLALIPEIASNSAENFFNGWLADLDRSHPAHAALARKLARIFNRRPALKAGFGNDGSHGERSLLQHSMLMCYLMLREARHWEYKGLFYRSGAVCLPLRDAEYRFDHHDPMIGVLGLAHDIGKLETFRFDDKDTERTFAVDSLPDHGLVGARMLARLPEVWALDDADRELLFLVVGHYHDLEDMPLEAPKRAISDRIHAMAELLAKLDAVASKMEREDVSYADADGETQTLSGTASARMRNRMFDSLMAVLQESGRINGPDPEYNVAFKVFHPRYHRHVLFLHEPNLLRVLPSRAGLDQFHTGIARGVISPFTKALLITLEEQGLLIKDAEGNIRGTEAAVFSAAFYRRRDYLTKTKDGVDAIRDPLNPQTARFKLLRTIVLQCEGPLAFAKDLRDHELIPHVTGTPFGARGVTRRRAGILDAAAEAQLQQAMVEPETDGDDPVAAAPPPTAPTAQADEQPGPDEPAPADPDPPAADNAGTLSPPSPPAPAPAAAPSAKASRRPSTAVETAIATAIAGRLRALAAPPPINPQGFYVVQDAAAALEGIEDVEAKLAFIAAGNVPGFKAKQVEGCGWVLGIDQRLLRFPSPPPAAPVEPEA